MYSTPLNARMAAKYGLSWIVRTDHGGPNQLVPEVLQFYGMELNMPAMDHHTLIIPRAADERTALYEIERRYDTDDAWPVDTARDTEAAARDALTYMKSLPRMPLVFANHPSRSATGIGQYGLDQPREIRANHDIAPGVYRGMEGAPGHQAATLAPDGSIRLSRGRPTGARGSYRNPGAQTLGGFDQMTAIVGGLWDALLGDAQSCR